MIKIIKHQFFLKLQDQNLVNSKGLTETTIEQSSGIHKFKIGKQCASS